MTRPARAGGADRRLGGGLLGALGYVSMAGSLSTDLYLPSFPDIADHFGVGASAVQFTLTAFLAGSALGQLAIGALSDALGRRRTLLWALALFVACSYAAAASPTLGMLVAVRALQGFAGSAGAVLARAVVADLVPPERSVRAFSMLFVMIALGPAVASPLGGWLAQVGGWRASLLGLAVIATGMFFVAALVIPESLPPGQRHPFTVGTLARNVARLLRNASFVGYAVAFGAGYAAFIVYISSSSFIVQNVFEIGPFGYALTFSLTSVAFMTGAWLSGRVARRLGAPRTLRGAQTLVLAAAAIAAMLAFADALALAAYLPLASVFSAGCGAVMSSASALAVGQAGNTAGAGSALIGFGQFLFGALASPLGGILGTATAVPATAFMAALAAAGLIAGLVGRARGTRRADA